jgi:hypothetical protein
MKILPMRGDHATRENTALYVADVNPADFPYVSATTGELAPSLWYVVWNTVVDLIRYDIHHHWMNVKRLQEELS